MKLDGIVAVEWNFYQSKDNFTLVTFKAFVYANNAFAHNVCKIHWKEKEIDVLLPEMCLLSQISLKEKALSLLPCQ